MRLGSSSEAAREAVPLAGLWALWRGFRDSIFVSRRFSRLLVLTCLTLTFVGTNYSVKYTQLNAAFEFRKLNVDAVESIKATAMTYAQVLTGAGAHIAARGEIDDADLAIYVAGLDLAKTLPGITAIGFIPDQGAGAALVALRDTADDAPPFEAFAALRRSAMDFARESRQTGVTPPLVTQGERGTRRALSGAVTSMMVRAVFANDTAQGQGDFLGWVYADFEGRSLLAGVGAALGMTYHLTVFDGDAVAQNRQFATDPEGGSAGVLQRDYAVPLYGRKWNVRFNSTPAFDVMYRSNLPLVVIAVGLITSFLLWLALWSVAMRSRLLRSLADKRARELDASADENRSLLETRVLAVLTLDADGKITFANSAAGTLFGLSPDALINEAFERFVSLSGPRKGPGISNATGKNAAGEMLKLDVHANAWRRADGVLQTTILVRDVTEQVQGKLAIEALHRRYSTALSGAGIGIFEVDVQTGKADMSPTWHQIMRTQDLGEPFDHKKHFVSRVHPDDLPALQEADRKCIAGEILRSEAEYRVRFPDGWRWMYSDAVPVARGADGRATRLIGTQSDITDIRHARNALELSEARFRMVVQDAPVGMAILNEKGDFVTTNLALATLSGYGSEVLEGEMGLTDLLSRKDFVRAARDIRALVGDPVTRTYQNQFQLRSYSGEIRWGLFNFSWTHDKNSGENVYIVQIVDITDQKRVERIKSEFVSTVSHELRTPLTSIKGALSLLDMTTGHTLPERARRLLEIANVNAERLTTMVNDILDLEKLGSGNVIFECSDTALAPLLEDTLASLEPVAREHENTLILAPLDPLLAVHVDVARLRQVLRNLVSNACKFSDPQTPVHLQAARRDNEVVIRVENTGPMVPESFRARLFDAFTQNDASDTRSRGGTGLGLHIASQIVRRMGGRIGFEQPEPRQTVFWFTCPLAVENSLPAPSEQDHGSLVQTHAPRVLHVEDDRDFADVIAAGFDGLAELSHASSIAQGRQLIGGGALDVVLLDWGLPDGHASELLDDIADHQPGAIVIGLSATRDMPDDPRILASLTKSQLDISDIVAKVLLARGKGAPDQRKTAI